MNRRPPCSTRTDTLFPYTTLFRSGRTSAGNAGDQVLDLDMPEVDRQADITDRFENDASGEGRRLFGIQVGVANLRQAQRIVASGIGVRVGNRAIRRVCLTESRLRTDRKSTRLNSSH